VIVNRLLLTASYDRPGLLNQTGPLATWLPTWKPQLHDSGIQWRWNKW